MKKNRKYVPVSKEYVPVRIFKKAKELHLYLDLDDLGADEYACDTYKETQHAFESTLTGIIRTTIPYFLSFNFAEKLFVHCSGEVHELKYDFIKYNEIRLGEPYNKEFMLLSGRYPWFNPYITKIETDVADENNKSLYYWMGRYEGYETNE